MKSKAVLGGILAVIALVVLVISLFSLPWYNLSSETTGSSYTSYEYQSDQNYYLDHVKIRSTTSGRVDTENINYEDEAVPEDNAVVTTFQNTRLIGIVGIIANLLAVIGAFAVAAGRLSGKIGAIFIVIAIIVVIIAPIYLMIQLPTAFRDEYDDNYPTVYEGPHQSFFGSKNENDYRYSWGGSSGWFLSVVSAVILVAASVLVSKTSSRSPQHDRVNNASKKLSEISPTPPPQPSRATPSSNSRSTRLISILGSGGAGKTVFFAMLSRVLGRGKYGDMSMEYGKGLGYLRDIRGSLESGRWPDKTYTGDGQLFTATIFEERTFQTKKYDISMIDIAGEDFDQVFDPDNPEIDPPPQFKDVRTASGYIFLVDPSRAYEDMWKFYRLIQYLVKVKGLKATGQVQKPVAIVFTKHDKYRELVREPWQFLEQKMPDLCNLITRRFKDRYIWVGCISAVGATTPDGDPRQPLSPRGIGPLMEWMIEKV